MKYIVAVLLLFTIAMLVLSACGKTGVQCSWSTENSVTLSVGPNEKAKCPGDDFIVSYTPIYLPGGVVISIDVLCARRVQTCKTVGL